MKKLLLTLLLASAALSHAATAPTLIPFQGRLTDQAGTIYTNGQYTLIFNLYDQAVGGNVLWTETHQKVGVVNGMVNVFLGSINPALASVDFSQTRHLGITIDADSNPNTPDPEMVPRQMIIPAFWAQNTSKMSGYDWTPLFGVNNPTGTFSGIKITAGTLPLTSLTPQAQASFGSTLAQNGTLPGLTAIEAINALDAVAITKDSGGIPRIGRASASSAANSGLYGFALSAAGVGQAVAVQQFGPLGGFSGLVPGKSYFLDTVPGRITQTFPAANPVYGGYSLSSTQLFADPFGISKSWGVENYWGSGVDGAFVSSGSNLFASTLDGDVVVKQFTSLTINANDFVSTDNRCKGLVIYVRGNATINGTLSMTARGANADPTLANSINPGGIVLVRKKSGASAAVTASDVGGPGTGGVGALWRAVEALQPAISVNATNYVVARAGGAGGVSPVNADTFTAGQSIANGTGGGASGNSRSAGARGGNGSGGTCYSGGTGGGGSYTISGYDGGPGVANGGSGGSGRSQDGNPAGGGAGNPGGLGGVSGQANSTQYAGEDGTGGLLILMVQGNLTIGSSGKIVSDGSQGGGQGGLFGGNSGGGRIIVLYGTAISNSGTVQATGNPNPGASRPPGGDGAVTIDKIDP